VVGRDQNALTHTASLVRPLRPGTHHRANSENTLLGKAVGG
jgi:hypothetical protein